MTSHTSSLGRRNIVIKNHEEYWHRGVLRPSPPRCPFCSCRVLSWRLSNTLDAGFCVEAVEEALGLYGAPEIFNTDQGSQFTSAEFTKVLRAARVKISMDGKGRWVDNVFVERLWRSLKYEEVYLKAYGGVGEAREGIGDWFKYYNTARRHQSLGRRTPAEVYDGTPPPEANRAA